MQINIAICDDELEICGQLESLLIEILNKKELEYNIDVFNRGKALCNEMKKEEYDLVFLDIELPEMNGINIGRYIREELGNEQVQIVYVSSKQEYAMELFEFRPMNFLVKPIKEDKIIQVIDKYLVISKQKNRFFEYKKGYELHKVSLSKILYFENNGRKITMTTEDDKVDFYSSIENIYQRVKRDRFLFIHKSIIINYDYIKKIGYEKIEMLDGEIFPISQSRRKVIREILMAIRKEGM